MAVSSAKFTAGRGSEKHLQEDAYSCDGGNFEGVVIRGAPGGWAHENPGGVPSGIPVGTLASWVVMPPLFWVGEQLDYGSVMGCEQPGAH